VRLVVVITAMVVCSAFAAPAQAAPGDLDPTFSGDGKQMTDWVSDDEATGVAIQADSKIVAVGKFGGCAHSH
jgi:hypothetical protein